MEAHFDPYQKWLGIAPKDQPPNHYRLLGLELFEADPEVIENAADRQMAYLRTFKTSQHVELSQRLLNEIAAARLCLLNREKRAAYDAELRSTLLADNPADAANRAAAEAPQVRRVRKLAEAIPRASPEALPSPDAAPVLRAAELPSITIGHGPAPSAAIGGDKTDWRAAATARRRRRIRLAAIASGSLVGAAVLGVILLLSYGGGSTQTTVASGNSQVAQPPTPAPRSDDPGNARPGRAERDGALPEGQHSGEASPNPAPPASSPTSAATLPAPATSQSQPAKSEPGPASPAAGVAALPPYAIKFDGADRVELAGTMGELSRFAQWTIECWALTDPNYRQHSICGSVARRRHQGGPTPVVGWLLAAFYTQSPQDLPFTFSLNPHLSRSLTADAWTVTRPLPEWKHLAVCCYGQHAIGFVNGKPSAPVPLEKLDPTLSNIVLGSPAVRDRWTFHGAIAGFRISTSPRYAGPFEPPMVLDDTDGAYVALDFSRPVPGQVRDLTGHGHHGALTGAKWVRREADGLVEIDPPPVQSPFHANLMKPLPPRLTNALSTVLLPDDALAGDWKLEGGQLTSPKDARALLLVRTPELPRRYSVNLAVELIEGKGELVVGLLAGGRAFSARLTNDHRGFDRVDGKPSSANETTTRGETFPPGTSVTLTCSTSDDAVRVFGRGGVLCSYQGSWERLSPDPEWSVGEPSLFLGTSDSVFRIKQFLVTPNEGLPRQRRPPEEELALVRKEFAEAMGAELTRPAGSEALRLTSKYRSMAFERHYSMAQRYVLLEESLRRARESKNAVSVLHAVDSLEMFEGEGIPRPASVLEELHEETPPGDGQAQLCKTALNASDNLRMRERLAEAQALLDLAVKAAERAGDDALLAKASAQRDEFRALQEYVEPGQKAERALAVSPQDSSALAARGKYYALVLLRWEGGLRHLKEGDDAALARVAELELASPKEGPALLRLADAWHQAAQSAESAARPTFQRKAMQWYRLALTKLPEGASKTRAERRYEELKEIVGEPDEGGAAQ